MSETKKPLLSAETAEAIIAFRDARDWKQFHTPKDLAIALTLEAAELLETFQWSGADTGCEGRRERIAEELADVFNCAVLIADACGIDPDEAVRAKLRRNAEKYPVEKARGNSRKYTELTEDI